VSKTSMAPRWEAALVPGSHGGRVSLLRHRRGEDTHGESTPGSISDEAPQLFFPLSLSRIWISLSADVAVGGAEATADEGIRSRGKGDEGRAASQDRPADLASAASFSMGKHLLFLSTHRLPLTSSMSLDRDFTAP
jgi:hypothetical protein